MACSSMNMTSPHVATARGILGNNGGLRRSSSGEDLCKQATMRRSYSDNHLLIRSSSCLRASMINRSSKLKPSRSFGIFSVPFSSSIVPSPIRSLLFDTEAENEMKSIEDGLGDYETGHEEEKNQKPKKANWIERLLELRMRWKDRQEQQYANKERDEVDDVEDGCPVDYGEGEEEEERAKFDADSFSKLLLQVPWSDARRFSKLAFLCNNAYKIPEIKAHDMQQYCGVDFITSSIEKKAEAIALKAKLDKDSTHLRADGLSTLEPKKRLALTQECKIQPSVAYEIAACAASHMQCCAKNDSCSIICGGVDHMGEEDVCPLSRGCNSERAAQMATSTMTAVVAAREREKQEAAKELQSLHSSPCEWYICDDPITRVRYFVIQGSESLAAWQANLFFEPTKFEDTDTLVHRGIYEAAKGIYEQFMPEIVNHINTHGTEAKFQFTGHSLGGSLSLLVHLMLIARGAVNPSTLLPVVTFGSPFVFCGGDRILSQLGLHENQVQCVILHRDIVPRAFSCIYPRQVARILKRLNGSFRSHPCLNKHKMLYSPLGQTFILQPAEIASPTHPLLPPGSALYTFNQAHPASAAIALREFLNIPHPLETLSDPTAYGSEGSILRDHDSSNYAKAVNGVLREYAKMAFRKVRKERHLMWPLIVSPSPHAWTHEGNLGNRSTRKEVMTSV